MTDALPDERPQRRREYSGPGSTLGLAALIVLVVAAGIWYFEFRGGDGSGGSSSSAYGIESLPESLNPTGKSPAAREGRAAPNFRLESTAQATPALTDFRGKWVLLNFWASWCPPCRDETPDLQSFYEHNNNRGLVVLGVNQQEKPDAARSFLQEFGVTYTSVLDTDGEVSETYGVGRGLPISFLVAPSGVIEKVYFGRLSEDNFSEIAARLQ
ncbi:MAG: TlpA disulfide reductase family protein [Dehalococcoidia bacterium]|jgi:peroxiredoxin